MIVVADSSPLLYLILLERAGLLHCLYGEVAIPDAVVVELLASRVPDPVRDWVAVLPPWLTVSIISAFEIGLVTTELDLGERAGIALAYRLRADLLLMNDAAGRTEARRRGFRVTGTLGVLHAAAELRLIDAEVLARLRATQFFVDDEVFAAPSR